MQTTSRRSFAPLGKAIVARTAFASLSALTIFAAGCSSDSKREDITFVPTENRAVTDQGQRGATYDVPVTTSPLGQVRVMSEGIEDVKARESEATVPALHLRMRVMNEKGTQPWTVDPRELIIDIEGDGSVKSTLVSTPSESLPLINVTPGETQDIDIYFALPEHYRTAVQIPGFTLHWQLKTEQQLVAENTPFRQITPFGDRLSVYPFDHGPLDSRWNRVPQSVGPGTEWWIDPFSNLPFPWYGEVY